MNKNLKLVIARTVGAVERERERERERVALLSTKNSKKLENKENIKNIENNKVVENTTLFATACFM